MSTVDQTPFTAPPLQTMAAPPVQVTYDDDDDILMDYEDEVPEEAAAATAATPAAANGGADSAAMMIENDERAANGSGDEPIAADRVHLRGVENMNGDAVKAFAAEHFDGDLRFVEWIDDNSCNLVYESPAVAASALEALQRPRETALPLLTPRAAKPASSSPDAYLEIRIARPTDRKEKGARERSRYYLFHPEEDRQERFERERRDTRRHRPRSDDGYTHGDYNKRHFDEREHTRRRRDDFAENMYDDDASALASRRRPRDRSRSFSPDRSYRRRSDSPSRSYRRDRDRDRDRRSRSPVELFPNRRPSSTTNAGVELFPSKLRAQQDSGGSGETPSAAGRELFSSAASRELFPKPARADSPEDKFHYPSPPRALPASSNGDTWKRGAEVRPAPQQQQHHQQPKELFPGKKPSLADRITFPPELAGSRGPDDEAAGTKGLRIKGLAGTGDDLFAEKLRQAKGSDLLHSDVLLNGGAGSGGGRRRRGRRAKAEDHFG